MLNFILFFQVILGTKIKDKLTKDHLVNLDFLEKMVQKEKGVTLVLMDFLAHLEILVEMERKVLME